MKEYMYTRILGVIVGTLTIIGAIGFGILSLIGISLSNALNSGTDYSSAEKSVAIIVFLLLLISGLMTLIGSTKLKNKAWYTFYTVFCLILGIGCIVTFFISFGSIGYKNELFIIGIGITYLLLFYLVKKGK
jgi:hypothetical protein